MTNSEISYDAVLHRKGIKQVLSAFGINSDLIKSPDALIARLKEMDREFRKHLSFESTDTSSICNKEIKDAISQCFNEILLFVSNAKVKTETSIFLIPCGDYQDLSGSINHSYTQGSQCNFRRIILAGSENHISINETISDLTKMEITKRSRFFHSGMFTQIINTKSTETKDIIPEACEKIFNYKWENHILPDVCVVIPKISWTEVVLNWSVKADKSYLQKVAFSCFDDKEIAKRITLDEKFKVVVRTILAAAKAKKISLSSTISA